MEALAAAPCARVDIHHPWYVSQGFDQQVLWGEADKIVVVVNGSDCCGRREAVEGDSSRGIGGGSSAHLDLLRRWSRGLTATRLFRKFYTSCREIFFGIIPQKGSLNNGKNVKDLLPVCTPVSELA
jgi:hypothetical protein